MARIEEKPFTVIGIEDSDYTQGDETTPGVKITTKETFKIDGDDWSKFHTTRIAVVNKLQNSKLRSDVNDGEPLGPVKCVSEKAKNGKAFFNLIDA